jgi:hypothetical protein
VDHGLVLAALPVEHAHLVAHAQAQRAPDVVRGVLAEREVGAGAEPDVAEDAGGSHESGGEREAPRW